MLGSALPTTPPPAVAGLAGTLVALATLPGTDMNAEAEGEPAGVRLVPAVVAPARAGMAMGCVVVAVAGVTLITEPRLGGAAAPGLGELSGAVGVAPSFGGGGGAAPSELDRSRSSRDGTFKALVAPPPPPSPTMLPGGCPPAHDHCSLPLGGGGSGGDSSPCSPRRWRVAAACGMTLTRGLSGADLEDVTGTGASAEDDGAAAAAAPALSL